MRLSIENEILRGQLYSYNVIYVTVNTDTTNTLHTRLCDITDGQLMQY